MDVRLAPLEVVGAAKDKLETLSNKILSDRRLAAIGLAGTLLLADLGIIAARYNVETDSMNCDALCIEYVKGIVSAEQQHEPAIESKTQIAPEQTLPTISAVPPSTKRVNPPTTIAPPPTSPPADLIRSLQTSASSEVLPLDLRTKVAIDSMGLSIEGYKEFVATGVDSSTLDQAQQYANFNPSRTTTPQHATRFITAHFTASYINFDKSDKTRPIGSDVDINGLLDFEGHRGNPCCGFNFFIDRNAHVYQFAPFTAKLRHNPPYDDITTGWEAEAYVQGDITAQQYEAAGYLSIMMWQADAGIRDQAFSSILHGHGHDRDKLRAEHPELRDKWEIRNDFDEPAKNYYVDHLQKFIDANLDQIKSIGIALR
jgi:hypothetical protein